MALFIRQDEQRSELQKRLATELRNKNLSGQNDLVDAPDGVEDSRYIEGSNKTKKLAWLWVLGATALIILLLWLTLSQLGR
jgi:hypothetical protein